MKVPCAICNQPSEENEHSRFGPWCDACVEDCTALGFALLMVKTPEDARGHWYYFQEWLHSEERRKGTHGLDNCVRCGFLLRLPFPIDHSIEQLCAECVRGKEIPDEEPAAFIRVTNPTYQLLKEQLDQMKISWSDGIVLLNTLLSNRKIREWALSESAKTKVQG